MEKKDYYQILGLTEEDKKLPSDEFEKKVKKIYRAESKKHHPDLFANASEAEKKSHEEKFKELNEAYEVLSDSKKRQQYDMGGMDFNPFGGWNMESPFGSGFGFNPFEGFGREPEKVGSDIKLNLTITLEDVLNGSDKTISFKRKVYCNECKREKCNNCHGTGVIKNITRNGFTTFVQEGICPSCNGTGYVTAGHCSHCEGKGYTLDTVNEVIKIPKGVESGMQIAVPNLGNDYLGYGGGRRGNLIIRFVVKDHDRFERYGNSLSCELPLTIEEAFNGCEAEVVSLSGTKLKINIPPLTKSGKQFRLAGKGLPDINNNSLFGPLICVVDYKVPEKPLTDRQKELLKEFYEIEEEKKR